jgi:hypothetical protein
VGILDVEKHLDLLPENDLASSAHVLSSLGSPLVLSGLEADHGFSSPHLLFGEFALVLVRGFGAQVGSFPLGMLVGRPAQGEDGVRDLADVLLLPQIHGLEDVNVVDAVGLQGRLEVVDVLHHLELSAGGVDLGDGAGGELVDQLAEDGAVADHIFVELSRGELGAEDGLDPLLRLPVLVGVALGGDLGADLTFQRHFAGGLVSDCGWEASRRLYKGAGSPTTP